MMTGAEPEHPASTAPDHAVERLIFFSDAVFAIAITLLVIEIHVPTLPRGASDAAAWVALAHLMPNFVGFFISFWVIGAFWAGHHRAFDCARHWSPTLVGPSLMLLSTIAAMPFFTAFMSRNGGTSVPVGVYCGWLLLTALANIRLQRTVLAPPVVRAGLDPAVAAMIRRRGIAVALGAATGIVVAIVAPWFAQVALVTIPMWRRLLERWSRPRAATGAQ